MDPSIISALAAVDGSTLAVQYAYAVSGSSSGNYARLSTLTYPNGRTLYLRYTTTSTDSKQDEIAAALSRPARLAASDANSGVYAEYIFAGRGLHIARTSPASSALGNDTKLNYDTGTADQYAGRDPFGRITRQAVTNSAGSTTRDLIEYAYRRDGAPKFAEPQAAVVLGRSSLYGYDDLHRLTKADTGLLSADRTAMLGEWSTPHKRTCTMDILGNITALNRENNDISAGETRTYNATNELTSRTVAGEAARYWVSDDFADNDTAAWEVANLDPTGGDGTWAASSGALACTGVITVPAFAYGPPDGGTGSILLVDDADYQRYPGHLLGHAECQLRQRWDRLRLRRLRQLLGQGLLQGPAEGLRVRGQRHDLVPAQQQQHHDHRRDALHDAGPGPGRGRGRLRRDRAGRAGGAVVQRRVR